VFGILLQLLHNSSNFKIRIQAAAALAVPLSVQGNVFSYHYFALVIFLTCFRWNNFKWEPLPFQWKLTTFSVKNIFIKAPKTPFFVKILIQHGLLRKMGFFEGFLPIFVVI
jgi:hypothetical protein